MKHWTYQNIKSKPISSQQIAERKKRRKKLVSSAKWHAKEWLWS